MDKKRHTKLQPRMEPYQLSEKMHESLNLAEDDLANNRIILHSDLMEELYQWIKEKQL